MLFFLITGVATPTLLQGGPQPFHVAGVPVID